MFYDALGSMLGQAGEALSRQNEASPDDARAQRDRRQLALLLRRTRAIWPELFSTLGGEIEVLEGALELANARLAELGLEPLALSERTDPLARYRETNRALDRAIRKLTTTSKGSEAALCAIRARLAEAAEIQGRLIDQMLAIR
ncbi:MAG: hypothetical protein JRG86_05890 [Deltaproteobacteria bacterium]|nr:hypothetical protein [Deltaproteobacteria bacterium]MBW2499156.1 hypothetical protein [Deltaproteobacteria bacterium]